MEINHSNPINDITYWGILIEIGYRNETEDI